MRVCWCLPSVTSQKGRESGRGFERWWEGDSLFKAFPTRMFSRACFPSTPYRVAILSIRSGRKVPTSIHNDEPQQTYPQYQRTQPTVSFRLVRVVLSPLHRPDRVVIEQSHTSYDTTASSHIETPHKPPK